MWKTGISDNGLRRISQSRDSSDWGYIDIEDKEVKSLFDKYISRLQEGEEVPISSKAYTAFIDYLDSIDHPQFSNLRSVPNPKQVGTKDDLLMSFRTNSIPDNIDQEYETRFKGLTEIDGVMIAKFDIFQNGEIVDGAWGTWDEIFAWCDEKGYPLPSEK